MVRSRRAFVDNDFYDREAAYWWSDSESPLAIIRYMMNPVRFAYVIRQLVELSYDYRSRKVLDIGCGGGFLTEEIAKFGLDTTGVDPSVPSLREARKHAKALNLAITYQEGAGEVLVPGGSFFFETVNRTLVTRPFFRTSVTWAAPASPHAWESSISCAKMVETAYCLLCKSKACLLNYESIH